MSVITKLSARQILDSRGNPTIEVTAYCGKHFAVASVPSGASTGSHEAHELRDGGKKYNGLGVTKSVRVVEKIISPLLKGMSVFDQAAVDAKMIQKDGTARKEKLGANSILGVSLAVARLGAHLSHQSLYVYLAKSYGFKKSFRLPTPLLNVLNGGLHADSGTDIQEFFFIPKRGKFADKLELGVGAILELKRILKKKRMSTGVGDEGGFAPQIHSNEKALRLLTSALHSAKIKVGKEVALGIDAAATEFYDIDKEIYALRADKKHFKPASMYRLYTRWAKRYHLEIIEDGCAEDDLVGWQKLTMHLGSHVRLVGDDLFVTDSSRLQAGIIAGVANTILIKPNQVGTLTETMEAIALAKKYSYQVIISHRSGETTDDFIADLAVAVSADYIKAGSLSRGERMAKYNRLLQIAEELKQ